MTITLLRYRKCPVRVNAHHQWQRWRRPAIPAIR